MLRRIQEYDKKEIKNVKRLRNLFLEPSVARLPRHDQKRNFE